VAAKRQKAITLAERWTRAVRIVSTSLRPKHRLSAKVASGGCRWTLLNEPARTPPEMTLCAT
jgi:hypothetical protein